MNLPTKEQLDRAWPFTAGKVDLDKLGPAHLDDGRPAEVRAPIYNIGDRVIAPGTPGVKDDVYRRGGPGVVQGVSIGAPGGDTFIYVKLDDCALDAQPYHLFELRAEPTV